MLTFFEEKSQRETAHSYLKYVDNIMFVRIKEGVEITIESIKQECAFQKEMVGNDNYVILIDGAKNFIIPDEARVYMAKNKSPNHLATAIVSNNNLSTQLMANFYLKINKPRAITFLFKYESEAILWLNSKLGDCI